MTRGQSIAARQAGYWNAAKVKIARKTELDRILICRDRRIVRRQTIIEPQAPKSILKRRTSAHPRANPPSNRNSASSSLVAPKPSNATQSNVSISSVKPPEQVANDRDAGSSPAIGNGDSADLTYSPAIASNTDDISPATSQSAANGGDAGRLVSSIGDGAGPTFLLAVQSNIVEENADILPGTSQSDQFGQKVKRRLVFYDDSSDEDENENPNAIKTPVPTLKRVFFIPKPVSPHLTVLRRPSQQSYAGFYKKKLPKLMPIDPTNSSPTASPRALSGSQNFSKGSASRIILNCIE